MVYTSPTKVFLSDPTFYAGLQKGSRNPGMNTFLTATAVGAVLLWGAAVQHDLSQFMLSLNV